MDLQQMKLYLMMEQCLRIVDYSLYFIAHLFTSGDANANYEDEDSEESEMMSESGSRSMSMASSMISVDLDSGDEDNLEKWKNFDLK